MKFFYVFLALICLSSTYARVYDNPSVNEIKAIRISEKIRIDGILDENIYKSPAFSKLIQADPTQGEPVSEHTEIWVGYDDEALYITAKCHDKSPDSIDVRLGRRDNSYSTDEFDIYLDSYNDKRNGFIFCITAAGTQHDGTISNDDQNYLDYTWDAVWDAETKVDSDGWTVEARIPFSQIRFNPSESLKMGINFERDIYRKNERSLAAIQPRNQNGFVSKFPVLVGIENIKLSSRIEVLPYINSKAEFTKHLPGDPFNDGSKYSPGAGVDIKYGLSSNLIFDGTINPDFGQVEVDPAVVNLTDVETYFNERRPFFTEGANVFQFANRGGTSFWNFNWSNPTLFYSRRIGRNPQGKIPMSDYSDIPVGTHILGAGKVTGKIFDNWNFATIHAFTKREFAQIQTDREKSEVEIEPLTYYSVLRTQRDFNEGRQGIGILSTFTKRLFKDKVLKNQINGSSLVVGLDGWTALDENKSYIFTGAGAFSYVKGNEKRMIALQRNSTHYFQRPDATHLSVDSSINSLSGYFGRFTLQKLRGEMKLNMALGFVSPGFEVNDLGFQTRSDVINYHIGSGYKWSDPTEYYRNMTFLVTWASSYDFEGNPLSRFLWGNYNITFTNYYNFDFSGALYLPSISNRLTRGGPLVKNPGNYEYNFNLQTDQRRPVILYANAGGFEGTESDYYMSIQIAVRPSATFNFIIGPEFDRNIVDRQWVTSYKDVTAINTYGRRYVFAKMDQKVFSANIRLNWILTPQLSLQVYLQPLITSGNYYEFKELLRPKTSDYMIYGNDGSTINKIDNNGSQYYQLDPDGNGQSVGATIYNPDFNYCSLRGNAVLRWEYLPGSTLYFVWTQSREQVEENGSFNPGHSFDRLLDVKPDNIFMIKFNYWLNL